MFHVRRFRVVLLLLCGLCAAPSLAEPIAVPVSTEVGGLDARAQWRLVCKIAPVRFATFLRVRDDHRAILANMAESIAAIDAAGEEANVPFFCFTPDVSPETVWLFDQFSRSTNKFQGTDAGRWTATATDGGGIQRGQRITLRVSFPSDGMPLLDASNTGFGEPNTPNNLNASFDAAFGTRATWKALFQQVFNDWSARANVAYVFDVADDPAPFPATPGSPNGRGDIRIAGHTIDGAGAGILAYNYGPNGGDMVIDTGNTLDSFAASTGNNFRLLRNTISHEHGHGLGFNHVCPVIGAIVMEPNITTAFDHSAEDDIRHANRKYGDPREGTNRNDTVANATTLGLLSIGTGDAGDYLSIDGNTDVDIFRVTTTAPRLVTVTLTPEGTLYQEGAQGTPNPQSDPTGCGNTVLNNTNGAAIINLNLDILGSNGTTVLATATPRPSGQEETISNLFLPGNGTYYLRVSTSDAAGANGNSNTQVQMYGLGVVSQSVGPNSLTIQTPSTNIVDGGRLVLSALADGFTPSLFIWRKDGTPLSTEVGPVLTVARVAASDAGSYTVEAEDGTKALIVSSPVVITIVPVGTLPTAGLAGLGILAAGLASAGLRVRRHRS